MKYILFILMCISSLSFAQLGVQITTDWVCFGDTTTFLAAGSDDIVSWYWDFGDGNFSSIQNTTHKYSSPGIYNVSLTVSNGLDTVTQNAEFLVGSIPIADFSINPSTITFEKKTVYFDGSNSSYDIINWHWDFAGLGTSNDTNPIFTFPDTGTYIITLAVVNEDACWDSVMYTIYTEHSVESLLIYPNPASDVFYIRDHAKYEKIYIINSNGNMMREEESDEEIDISVLNKGMYFIKLLDKENKIYVQKIIKE